MHDLLSTFLNIFASAGGGGSGSGGSGGGGIAVLFFMIGYLPTYFLGRAQFRKKKDHKDDAEWWSNRQIITWSVSAVYGMILFAISILVMFSSEFFLFMMMLVATAGAPVGAGSGLYNWFSKIKRNKQEEAELQASGWDEAALTEGAKRVFLTYQRDWSNNDTAPMAGYMTPNYFEHAKCMVEALKQIGRRNDMSDVKITEALITSVDDNSDDSKDSFVIGFTAQAKDKIISIQDNKAITNNPASFTEFWKFYRDGSSWRLGGIQPATAEEWTRNPSLEQFASANNFFYSLDWGWLLLPQRGQLFNGGKFGISDINNHCIGWHQGTYDRILTQLYTYRMSASAANTYLIAQATLPRNYGDIVVRRRKGLFQGKINGLREVSTEWSDFNKLYQVFATSPEQATSLELLNPQYMERLAAIPFEVNIEVVDNVLYIYAPLQGFSGKNLKDPLYQNGELANKYQMLLWALEAAFKEMKM